MSNHRFQPTLGSAELHDVRFSIRVLPQRRGLAISLVSAKEPLKQSLIRPEWVDAADLKEMMRRWKAKESLRMPRLCVPQYVFDLLTTGFCRAPTVTPLSECGSKKLNFERRK